MHQSKQFKDDSEDITQSIKHKVGNKPAQDLKKTLSYHIFCFNLLSFNEFFRYSTGWKCGLHPDWTELTECVDDYLNSIEELAKRRYFYITFLRDPVRRYLSEFKHVQRGATWKKSEHKCNGKPATRSGFKPGKLTTLIFTSRVIRIMFEEGGR